MRIRCTSMLLAAILFAPGCSFVHIIKDNLILEPKRLVENRMILQRHERLAQLAWEEMVSQYGCEFSSDYRDGFIDGFVDFLTFGSVAPEGLGDEPMVPAVPPPRYRKAKAMSPEGLKGAEDWFAGFRHGSCTAQASGLRKLVEVPLFDIPNPALSEGARYRELPGRSPSEGGSSTNPSAGNQGEVLPPPKAVSAGDQPPVAGGAVPPPGGAGPAANPQPPGGPAGPTAPPGGPAIPPAGGAPPPG
jgi:hypothetical protein